jgi:hypothetical protein
MPRFNDVLEACGPHLYEVEWYPLDTPGPMTVKTYVVASNLTEAGQKISDNENDIVSISHKGPVLEKHVPANLSVAA